MVAAARAGVLVALTAVCAASAGCGSSEPRRDMSAESQARAVVERFGTATAHRDYQTICDELLADTLVQRVENVGLPCEVAFEKGVGAVRDPRIQVRQVRVQGGRALVSIHSTATGQAPSDDAVQLVRQGNEWRIASLVSPSGQSTTAATTTPPATTSVPTPDHDDRDAAARRKRQLEAQKQRAKQRERKSGNR